VKFVLACFVTGMHSPNLRQQLLILFAIFSATLIDVAAIDMCMLCIHITMCLARQCIQQSWSSSDSSSLTPSYPSRESHLASLMSWQSCSNSMHPAEPALCTSTSYLTLQPSKMALTLRHHTIVLAVLTTVYSDTQCTHKQ